MKIFLVFLSFLFILLGFVGTILPLLPGPLFAYIGLVLFHFGCSSASISPFIFLSLGVLVLVMGVLDYLMPMYGSRFFGGSKYGVWGISIGLILGVFTSWLGPWGILFGPFFGAFFGEVFYTHEVKKSFLAACGAFLGFLGSSFIAFLYCSIVSFILLFYLVKSWF
jgi:uncharacterized protein YqgC (DUF456 family)